MPCRVSKAIKSWAFPEKMPGIIPAAIGYVLFSQVPLVSVLQGGSYLTEHITQREKGDDHAHESCVKVASHFAFQCIALTKHFIALCDNLCCNS